MSRRVNEKDAFGMVTKGLSMEHKVKALMQAADKFGLKITPKEVKAMLLRFVWERYEAYVRCRFKHDINTTWEVIDWIDANCEQ